MLSRVADALYWMSRYMERAENIARFIDANLNLMLDPVPGTEEQWEPLVRTTADLPLFREHYSEPTRSNVIEFLTFDPDNPNSILRCLKSARDNARGIRDVISSEMWEQVNMSYLFVHGASFRELDPGDTHSFFKLVKTNSHTLNGIRASTMSHGEGWHFCELGRQIERADKTCRLLDVKYFILLPEASDVGSPIDVLQWHGLLKSASALEMFRKRHGRISPRRVAQFLVLDTEFPRAINYCLNAAQESLHTISGGRIGTFSNPAEQRLGLLCSRLNFSTIEEIVSVGMHKYLDEIQIELNQIGDAIYETFCAPRRVEGLVGDGLLASQPSGAVE